MPHQPKSLSELRKSHNKVRNVNKEQKERLSKLDRLAIWITQHVGSMGFFIIIFLWTAIWLSWNTLAPVQSRFDPFPAFVLWLFVSNMIQIFLMPLIMVGQNLQADHSEARAESDFEINTKAEEEIETILMHLENQNETIIQILNEVQKIKTQ